MTKIRAARSAHNGMLFISGMLVTVLLWGEVTHAAWLQGRSAAILSAFTLVASNVLAKTLLLSPQFGIGVLDLIYSHCLSLAFLGALFTKLHPEKPLVVPDGAEQAVQALSVGASDRSLRRAVSARPEGDRGGQATRSFFSSACSMLLLGGLYVGPATAVLLVIALQSSIATLWTAEEHLAAPLLLIAVLVGTVIGAREEGGEWMWSAFFGLCAAVGRATCALQQRNFACQMHHVVTVTYAGIIGLIMFGPIAAAYPQHARAILTMEMHNLAPLVLFGVNWARFTQSSIALAATCMIFSYAVSYKQVLRAEQCFTSAYSLFEPQNFEQDNRNASEFGCLPSCLKLFCMVTITAGLSGRVFHGVRRRFPEKSTVYLTGVGGPELEGEPCEVVGVQQSRWLVRFLHPRFNGQSALVPEECLNFGYCVRPVAAPGRPGRSVETNDPRTGRGLAAAQKIGQGQIIFEESPFLITTDDVNEQRPPNDADDELRELRFAVFAQVSRLNHSCAPSADVGYVFQPFQSGSAVPDDGKSVVRAMRDLDAGEALEINYGPPQLLEWPLARRREFLQAQNGFLCQCRRCRDEANAQRREDP
eukprot:g6177.t1